MEHLSRFEEEFHRLYEEKLMIMNDSNSLKEQFESLVMEKEDIECRAYEALEALEEEREVRNILEDKLKEDSRLLPVAHPSWADNGGSQDVEEGTHQVSLSCEEDEEKKIHSNSSSTANKVHSLSNGFHSTPKTSPHPDSYQASNLLNELQDSVSQGEELELRQKVSELEELARTFQKEKQIMEEQVSAASARETAHLKEISCFREEYAKGSSEKDKLVEDLSQKVVIRDEQIGQLRNKLSTANAEKTYLEIEVDGLSNEVHRLKVVSGLELDKIQREISHELVKNIELKSKISVLEDQLDGSVRVVDKLEEILLNSHDELLAMSEDIKSLEKVMATLGSDTLTPTAPTTSISLTHTAGKGNTGEPTPHQNGQILDETPQENGQPLEETEIYFMLELRKEKHSPIQVHAESHSLKAIINLREQLKSTRSPLENFTKVMLERSLVHAAKHTSSASPCPYSPDHMDGTARKNTLDLEASISKWKSKYMHKAEENVNLRSIMKARATTTDVGISSLKSKLGSQARAYQTELTKMKYQIKILRKEKDEHFSLRNMYAKRCEDYIDEITRAKKLMEKRKQEYDDVMVSLQRTIQRKLELSTELEEYKVEHERSVLVPAASQPSRV